MRFSSNALTCLALLATAASAAPSTSGPASELTFTSPLPPSNSLTSWLSSSIHFYLSPLLRLGSQSDREHAALTTFHGSGSGSDKTIYDVITTNPHFSKLAKALNYSSDSTKDLLKGKTGIPLTIFAPVDWEEHHHDATILDATHSAALMQSINGWSIVSKHIEDYENMLTSLDLSDDDKEKRRRRLAFFIDAVLAYHLIDADKETISSTQLAQNSTVGTKLTIDGKVAEYIGKLNDGLPLRIRVGKSLLPRPGIYLNFYSRVVYPDVKLANGVLHAVQYPLFQFPSILQGLYWSQPQFSTLTTALLKTEAEGYLALPTPKHLKHGDQIASHAHAHGHGNGLTDPKGSTAATFFTPSNVAWSRLPWGFRAFLFSPGKGRDLLGKILMLHAIPNDIVYADSVHHVNGHGKATEVQGETYTLDASSVMAKFWGNDDHADHDGDDDGERPPPPHGSYNVTKYVFDSVLPKLCHDDDDGDDGKNDKLASSPGKATQFEKVYVEVIRYYLLPGCKGPLQTRLAVQGVPVLVHDVVNLNGASHLITRFIKPEGHPHQGVWAEVAREAELAGFGRVDLVQEARMGRW